MRKTLAILGTTGSYLPEVLEILMNQDLRLLFVSEDEVQNRKIKTKLKGSGVAAEVEFITCEIDGCWEADMILITDTEKASGSLLRRIREVATQKTVLIISETERQPEDKNLQPLLPNSKVVEIMMDFEKKEFSVSGKDSEARGEVQEIFGKSGYQHKVNSGSPQ